MSLAVPSPSVEPFIAGLLGAIDVDGGPTGEQLSVLSAMAKHLWHREDLVHTASPIGPAEVAERITDPVTRRRFHEILLTLEVCRHPLTRSQVDRVEQYGSSLHFEGPDLKILRDLVDSGVAAASADFKRFLMKNLDARIEPQLRQVRVTAEPEPGLVARLRPLADLPDGTLGRAFIDMYERNEIPLPGIRGAKMNHWFVAHDMTHVIAGIDTTIPGEVALSAFQMALDDNEVNRGALLGSLVVHEAGFAQSAKVRSESATLDTPGAAELLGQEMARGAACRADFSLVDHLAIAHHPLAEIRADFGVAPPADPDDGHHCW